MTDTEHDPAPVAPGETVGSEIAASDGDLLEAIAAVAREHLKWNGPIAPEMSLVEALALDSLRQLTLVVEIENRFRIRLDGTDEASLQTVGDLIALIARKRARRTQDAR